MNIFILNSFRFTGKIQPQYKEFLYISYPTSPTTNILHQYSIFVTITEPILICFYEQRSIIYSYFIRFYLYSRILSRIPHCIYSPCLLGLLLAVRVSQTFLVWLTLAVLKCNSQIFCKTSLLRFVLCFLLFIQEIIPEFQNQNHRNKVITSGERNTLSV